MRASVWRRRPGLWIPPVVFCAINVLMFVLYHVGYAGKVDNLHEVLESAAGERAALEVRRGETEAFIDRIAANDRDVARLYEEYFSTEAERFTRVITEVKRLARQAGLDPTSISYPSEDLDEWGLERRRIVFSVQGSYDQLRTFINFLELSNQFLTLDSVSLSGSSDSDAALSISLTVSTVFEASAERSATS